MAHQIPIFAVIPYMDKTRELPSKKTRQTRIKDESEQYQERLNFAEPVDSTRTTPVRTKSPRPEDKPYEPNYDNA